MLSKPYSIFKKLSHALWHFIGAAMLDQIMVSGVSFFVGFYLARHLGINQFGQFSLILIITYFCLEIQRAIVIAPMMTLFAKNDSTDYLSQLGYLQLIFNLAISLVASAFVFLSGYLFPKWGIGNLTVVTSFMIFGRLQQEFLRRIFFVLGFARRALILDFITFSMILISIFLLIHTDHLTLKNVLWWHVAGYLCPSFLAMTYVLNPRIHRGHWLIICQEHLQFGRWLVGGAIVQFFSINWLIMVSGAILGASTVGLIKSAQYLMGGVTMLFQALENVVPLRLARLYHQADPLKPRRYLYHLSLFMAVFIVSYILAMMYVVPYCADYLHIQDKKLFYKIAMSLVWQSALFAPVLILTYILRAKSMTKPVFFTHALTAVITVLAAPTIIRLWHEMAVIYGIAVIQVIIIICFSFFIIRSKRHA